MLPPDPLNIGLPVRGVSACPVATPDYVDVLVGWCRSVPVSCGSACPGVSESGDGDRYSSAQWVASAERCRYLDPSQNGPLHARLDRLPVTRQAHPGSSHSHRQGCSCSPRWTSQGGARCSLWLTSCRAGCDQANGARPRRDFAQCPRGVAARTGPRRRAQHLRVAAPHRVDLTNHVEAPSRAPVLIAAIGECRRREYVPSAGCAAGPTAGGRSAGSDRRRSGAREGAGFVLAAPAELPLRVGDHQYLPAFRVLAAAALTLGLATHRPVDHAFDRTSSSRR